MATGNKILGIGPVEGDAADLLKQTGTGRMFDYDDSNGIAAFIRQHYNEWKEGRIQRMVPEQVLSFSRPALTAKLAGIIRALAR